MLSLYAPTLATPTRHSALRRVRQRQHRSHVNAQFLAFIAQRLSLGLSGRWLQ
jgi:hypothetical protein